MRTIGTAAELERRRRHAVGLCNQGEKPKLVARLLGIDRSSLYRWRKAAAVSIDRLDAKPHPGRTPRLNDDQLAQLQVLLLQGAQTHGWSTDLWTADRVTQLIRREFGIDHHPEHVRKILKQRLNWTSHKPQRRARERDAKEVERWKADEFPRILRDAWQRQAHVVFLDESGFQLTPCVRRTLWPRGLVPIHESWDRRDRISAISCLTVSPQRARLGLYFELLPDKQTVKAPNIIAFLRKLKQHLSGPLTIVWDRSSTHDKSLVVRAYLAKHPEIVTEKFPGYAPELNPDELVWSYTKYGRLANLAAWDTRELREHLVAELTALRQKPDLLASFVNHAHLPLRL
jgi:transposase